MSAPNQPNREKQIFERALDLASPDPRRAYLEAACGHDAALLARVRSLLRAHTEAESFLPEEPLAAGAQTVLSAAASALASEAIRVALAISGGDTANALASTGTSLGVWTCH